MKPELVQGSILCDLDALKVDLQEHLKIIYLQLGTGYELDLWPDVWSFYWQLKELVHEYLE
uniref:Uncharacterized protein n=1 Tax=Strigamia maritima TaxID=126957 RepID=T1IKP4_STRMM